MVQIKIHGFFLWNFYYWFCRFIDYIYVIYNIMKAEKVSQKSGNTDKHFKGQLETEVVECFFRKHWIVILKDVAGFFIFLCVMGFVAYNYKAVYDFFAQDSFIISILSFFLIALFTVYLHRFFLRFFRYFLDIVIFTNYRIVVLDKSLYLRNTKEAIDLTQIQDIEKEQVGVIPNLLRYGTLIIVLSASSAIKKLPFVPNADFHFRKINKMKREYIKEKFKYDRDERVDLNIPKRENINADAVEVYSGLS